jgi:hypothetical protein
VDEHQHFTRFKDSHRQGMALAQVERHGHTSSNGAGSASALQGIKHLPDRLPAKQHWRDRLRSWWHRFEREWEPVTVNKQIDSVTMPKWAVIAIFGAMLAFGAQSWWRASDQRDMLIEMRTEQRIAKEAKMAEDAEKKAQVAEEKAWREIMHGNQKKIEGMLTQQQLDALDRLKRSGSQQQ